MNQPMYKIKFRDDGQSFTEWTLDKEGEVLDSKPFDAELWRGKKIDLNRLFKRKEVEILGGVILRYQVKKIEVLINN